VTDRGSDDRLGEAFRAWSDSSSSEVPDELRERIWRAVSGELPPAERRALVDRLADDPASAQAWRVAHEMWEAAQAAEGRSVVPGPARRWVSPWLAAAAVLVISTGIALVWLLRAPAGDEFRTSPGYVVESLVADAPLPRNAFTLRWTPGPAGSRYLVRVTSEDLQLLATGADLTTPVFVVESDRLSNLPSGAGVLWQVEASLPTGERVTSPTFIARVE
jgi:hypothetical protein